MFSNIIKIKNFGPIKNAEIKNSKLTVLIGSNSSGKSFIALLIHSLLNPIGEKETNFSKLSRDLNFDSYIHLVENNSPNYQNFTENITQYIKTKEYEKNPFIILKEDLEILVDEGIGYQYGILLEKKLKQVFSIEDLDKLIHLDEEYFEIEYNNMIIVKKEVKNSKLKK